VHRPISLLHVVGSEQVGNSSELQKKIVLEAKQRRRPHDGCLGKYAARDFLASALPFVRECGVTEYAPRFYHTLVAKNDDGEDESAL